MPKLATRMSQFAAVTLRWKDWQISQERGTRTSKTCQRGSNRIGRLTHSEEFSRRLGVLGTEAGNRITVLVVERLLLFVFTLLNLLLFFLRSAGIVCVELLEWMKSILETKLVSSLRIAVLIRVCQTMLVDRRTIRFLPVLGAGHRHVC
jgi:hypothetical protein